MSFASNLVPRDSNRPVWIRVGTLFDGSDSAPIPNANLVYDADAILFVGDADSFPSAEMLGDDRNKPDLDLPDHTVVPGLIDSHVHLFLEGGELDFEKRKAYLLQSPDELLAQARDRLETLIEIGVMGVRDAGDKDGVGLALASDYKAEERTPAPYLDSPGPAIHHKGRYGKFMGSPVEEYGSPEECVEGRIALGADRIKLIPTGIINFKEGKVTAAPQMTAEEVGAFVEASKARGKQTFAHASGSEGVENAIEGGVDSVEHAYFVTNDQLAKMRDRDIAWVPTFTPLQAQIDYADKMGWPDETVVHLERILDGHSKSLVRARDTGVRVIAGSDAGSCGVAHGLGFLEELERMERAGLGARDVLYMATGAAAERLAFHDPIGHLKPGSKTRFMLTEHSPLETVRNLRKGKVCVFDGRVYESNDDASYAGL